MCDLFIILCSVVGVLVYIQIGRFLGWWSHRTMQEHLRYKTTIWERRTSWDDDTHPEIFFTSLKQGPGWDMCLLFPVLSLGWKKGDEEVISSGLLLDILHSGSKESEEIYRWMMFIFWPLKVIWCLLVWIGIGLFLSARLGLRFLRWSYRLIFTWPERKTADGKPKEPTKAASQEHTVN